MSETPETPSPRTPLDLRPVAARTWVDLAVLLVFVMLGVVGFVPSFGGYSFLLAGVGGLLVGAATGLAASIFRLSVILTVLAAIVGYFLFGSAFAVPQQAVFGFLPSLSALSSLAVGTVYGWADIITLRTPIGAPLYITVVPYFATWLVALLSTSLAVRWLSARPRTVWRFGVVLIGPVALYIASILIGTDEPYQAGLRGILFAVLALVWLGWRRPNLASAREGGSNRLRNRKLAGTAIIVVASVVLGGGAGFLFAPANDERFVLREEIEPPFDPLQYPSPLSGFRHYTKQVTDEPLFTVDGLKTGDVVRLATLDSFTGKLWTVTGPEAGADGSGSFALVGRTINAPEFITPEPRTNITVTIEGYDDVWVPSVGYLTDFTLTGENATADGDNLRYNSATGTAVLTSGLSRGDSYEFDAVAQRIINPTDLEATQVANVELPPVAGSPDLATSKAQEFAGAASTPIEQLQAIQLALAETGYLSHGRASDSVPSRAGHGADRITELFERLQMIGDEEQYASAFALMARSFGYPARVVMGFAPEVGEDATSVTVTGDDVTAWVEVAFQDAGWVAFNPTPDETDIPQAQVPKPQSEPQPQVRQPPRSENDDDDLLTPVELEESDDDEKDDPFTLPRWFWILGLSLLVPALILLAPMLVVAAVKTRRARKRRQSARGADSVAGAWDELVDQYSELGFEVPSRATRLRVADGIEAQLPELTGAPLRSLAGSVDEAVFSGREVETERRDEVWTEALAAVELARGALSGSRRLASRYRLRRRRGRR
jgi:hypothetical protein